MSNVIIEHRDINKYPKESPFRPSIKYPEYAFDEINNQDNQVYDMVRSCFYRAGYDIENYGSPTWNPLGHLIKPGDYVLIKPNLVMDVNANGEGEECLYTQPSVVAPVLDYVFIALKGIGTIVVGDAPMQECKFDKLINESGYKSLIEWCQRNYKGINVELIDFRGLHSNVINGIHQYEEGTQSGVIVNLGNNSEFASINDYQSNNIRITNYDPSILKRYHNKTTHNYFISKYVLNADVIINMPKPKTHRKAGVTISLKNIIGINTRKECLPHHTNGSINEGGDEYLNKLISKRISSYCKDKINYAAQTSHNTFSTKFWSLIDRGCSIVSSLLQKDNYAEGSWYGNNTISKTILDLNKILFYCDKNGTMQKDVQRKYLIVADMIVSGEKEGPVIPSPKNVGMIAIGENPISFDRIIATLMGADISKIPTLNQINNQTPYVVNYDKEEKIISNDPNLNGKTQTTITNKQILWFIPTSGWRNAFKCQK